MEIFMGINKLVDTAIAECDVFNEKIQKLIKEQRLVEEKLLKIRKNIPEIVPNEPEELPPEIIVTGSLIDASKKFRNKFKASPLVDFRAYRPAKANYAVITENALSEVMQITAQLKLMPTENTQQLSHSPKVIQTEEEIKLKNAVAKLQILKLKANECLFNECSERKFFLKNVESSNFFHVNIGSHDALLAYENPVQLRDLITAKCEEDIAGLKCQVLKRLEDIAKLPGIDQKYLKNLNDVIIIIQTF